MWIATQDITGQVIFVWFQDEQIELRRKILVDEAAGVIGVAGDYERVSL